jgi:simple sugar transport system permease protein
MAASQQSVTQNPRRNIPPIVARAGLFGLALVGALVITSLTLLATGVSPLPVYRQLALGAFESQIKLADAAMLAAPLLLCAAGLTLTFGAGLYNLGVEGQMGVGAVFGLLVVRLLPTAPPPLVWVLALLGAALGGALWALVAAFLKLYGRVSEIFAGQGMNFLAIGLTLYLVVGPWKKPGVAAITGTELLPNEVWLPMVKGLRLAPVSPILALIGLAAVWFALTRTRWGLAVRAAGLNPAAAERLGVPTNRRILETMACCGALAGVAGGLQVLAVYHQLVPNISSGIGLTGMLVALLVQANPTFVLPVVVAFASFTVASIRLPLSLHVDSSIAGVLQGALVLCALVAQGLRRGR